MAFAEAWQRHSRHATGGAEPASVETGLTCMLPVFLECLLPTLGTPCKLSRGERVLLSCKNK